MLSQKHSTAFVATDTFFTVQVSEHLRYRLQHATTLQEAATSDRNLVTHITRQLDAMGIEYAVFINNSDTFLLCRDEWIVSWGGILYMPADFT